MELFPSARMPGQVSPPGPRRRALRAAAGIGVALLLAYGAAQAAVRHTCRDGTLHARIAAAIEARLGPVELGPDVAIDPLFRVRFGPLTIPGALAGDAPVVRVESVGVRADLFHLLRTGRAAPAGVTLDGVRLELPSTAEGFAALARRLPHHPTAPESQAANTPSPALPTVRARDLEVVFTLRDRQAVARVSQAQVRPQRAPDGSPSVTATLALLGGGRGAIEVRREDGGWRAAAHLDDVDPAALPEGLASTAAGWSGGTVSLRCEGVYQPARREARAEVQVAGRGLVVDGPVVGAEAIGPLDLAVRGTLVWDGAAHRATLDGGRVTLPGGAELALDAALGLGKELPLSVRVRAQAVDFLAFTAGLPPALSLPVGAPRPSGTFDAHLAVAGPLADPAAWQVDAGLDLTRMRKEARLAAPATLTGTFLHHAEVDGGAPRAILIGSGNPDFVPVVELPAYAVRAVTTSEDAGFFGHQGFDFAELRNAAVQGAQAGRVVRGGSTISQQLAKNLYLSREKTLSRKLREALTTVALEATVPKPRLLEIYLNVAEWGPGLFGIGPAARHWFGKDARALTPREAAFLATVIPNPVRYHYMWSRGFLSEHWEERVDGLLRTMATQGVLTETELAEALAQPLTFARCATGPEAAPDGPATCRGT